MCEDFSKELPVGVLVMNGAIRYILDVSWTDCCYRGRMIRGEISREIDSDVS